MPPLAVEIVQDSYDWWQLVPAVVGGVIGALAGGIPAWLLARRSSKESLSRDREIRKEAQLAAAFRIFTKLSMMVNDLASTLMQIEEMLKRPVDPYDESPTQRRVSAFAGASSEAERFSADELAILVAANETDYLTELDLFGRRYQAFLRTLGTYGQLKSKLHDLLSQSEDLQFGPGDTLRSRTTMKNAQILRMQSRTLESVAVPMIDGCERTRRLA